VPDLSEKSLAKARRLVSEGRVREVTAARTFVVVGDHGSYRVHLTPDGATCDCPAYVAHCSHVEAALLAIAGPPGLPPWLAPAADQPQAQAPRPRLFTWYWRAALDADPAGVTPVRISLGRPRWAHAARTAAIPYISELAPVGHLFDLDGPEFDRAYQERLDQIGVDRIEQRFREVTAAYGGRPHVLLCFERDRGDCHRGTFATWWRERTGEVIPEFA
jgi:hypothetical protein